MDSPIEERKDLSVPLNPSVVLAEVIEEVISLQIDAQKAAFQRAGKELPEENTLLELATKGECKHSSIRAGYILSQKYPGLFDNILLLSSKYERSQQPEQSDEFFEKALSEHTRLVLFKGNSVFSISPAWFRNGEDFDRARFIIEGHEDTKEKSLKSVLSQIKTFDGGVWPDEVNVAEMIKLGYQDPSVIVDENEKVDEFISLFSNSPDKNMQAVVEDAMENPDFYNKVFSIFEITLNPKGTQMEIRNMGLPYFLYKGFMALRMASSDFMQSSAIF